MSFQQMKPFWIGGALFGFLFAVLFSIRIDLFQKVRPPASLPSVPLSSAPSKRDRWMNIFQNDRKIGFSHSTFSKVENGYHLQETLRLRINTMGMIQNLSLNTTGWLHPDLTIGSFELTISSGRFQFRAEGAVSENVLSIQTKTAGNTEKVEIELKDRLYLFAGIIEAVTAEDLKPGETRTYYLFDPVTMGRAPVEIRYLDKENIRVMGRAQSAKKVSFSFKGATQTAWIGEDGRVLKESGLLGITLERTTKDDALFGLPMESSRDLTTVASVPSNVAIKNPEKLSSLTVKLGGIAPDRYFLQGGRQTFHDNILIVRKETLKNDIPDTNIPKDISADYLRPSPLIQSDHPKIVTLATDITSPAGTPLAKAMKLVSWVNKQIEKRPVLSLPDALSTLENRMGDCNEHAVLLAALARAAGIPARLEAGLVFLNGRFYYHAWNLLYLGRWITADATLGQMPADATHLRFSSGSRNLPLDLLGIIGKVKITVIELKE